MRTRILVATDRMEVSLPARGRRRREGKGMDLRERMRMKGLEKMIRVRIGRIMKMSRSLKRVGLSQLCW